MPLTSPIIIFLEHPAFSIHRRPVDLPFSLLSFISTDDDRSTLQVPTSVLLTGAIPIFLFRSSRRRAAKCQRTGSISNQCFSLVCFISISRV
ncbi:hypothetical protein Hanom_Chr08g00728231 [Helianthus anomalus]